MHQVEYVSADQGGGSIVAVNEPHAQSWETFTLTLSPPPSSAALVGHDKVIDYLMSVSGTRTVTGQHDKLNDQPHVSTDQIQSITGKIPGLWSADFGFGSEGVDNRAQMIAEAETQWSQGAIVQLMYHNCLPTGDEYCTWDDIGGATPQHLTDAQWSDLTTDGTALNQAWKGRLDTLSPFFAELQAKGVAPLFRPLHEMNQGVFWWGGRSGPTGTVKLFQITHDYLVRQKGFTNIVWVWDIQDFGTLGTDVNDYDPGPAYYDIAALDVYDGGGYTQDKYTTMFRQGGPQALRRGRVRAPAHRERARGPARLGLLHAVAGFHRGGPGGAPLDLHRLAGGHAGPDARVEVGVLRPHGGLQARDAPIPRASPRREPR